MRQWVQGRRDDTPSLLGARIRRAGSPAGRIKLCEMTAVDLAGRLRRTSQHAKYVGTSGADRTRQFEGQRDRDTGRRAGDGEAARADDTLARRHVKCCTVACGARPRGHGGNSNDSRVTVLRDNIPSTTRSSSRGSAPRAITVGKRNTPELGRIPDVQSVFGATRNPYDLTKTCGGSSGGAATALACRMLPIADGSDTGGSLRNPPAFCNVVGLRPSPGRVASESTSWSPLAVSGPIARTVADVALFLSAIAGFDPRSPLSIQEDGARFRGPLEKNLKGARVAWWRGLGGIPFEPEIRRVVDGNRKVFEDMGCVVEEAEPDLKGLDEAFPLIRYTSNYAQYAPLVQQHPEWVKDTIKFEVAQAERATGADLGRAWARQTHMFDESRSFFESYQLHPSGHTGAAVRRQRSAPTQIAGTTMTTYIDWMRSCCA